MMTQMKRNKMLTFYSPNPNPKPKPNEDYGNGIKVLAFSLEAKFFIEILLHNIHRMNLSERRFKHPVVLVMTST